MSYEDPSQPGSLGKVSAFAKARSISREKAQRQLRQKLIYTLHKLRSFYEQDFQKVVVPDDALFRVDKVLKRQGNQVFVAWKGWPKEYNSWIWKKDLVL
ncbi:unnamed protein product [Porites evermanni]|uniref:Chromo domain-containing protein n=1 Tax=Porites evermanni TaxID=104178 RepID=A0ABN8LNE4_9CNID|nr:unnamed protein product [Porites evermanni]